MHSIYVLCSEKDKGWYIGSSADVERRIKDHNYGKVRSTKYRRPLKLIYREDFPNKILAQKQKNTTKAEQEEPN